MNPEQIRLFRQKASALGKSDAEIDSYIRLKTGYQEPTQPELFSPRQPEAPTPAPVKQQTTGGKVWSGIGQGLSDAGQSAVGTGKGILSTINNASAFGQKALNKLTSWIPGVGKQEVASLPKGAVTPTDKQKPAFVGEQIGEFLIPGTAVTKTNKAIDAAVNAKNISTVGAGALRMLGKGLSEAAGAGIVRTAQTGDIKEGAKTGAFAGALAGGASVVGDLMRGARIPEWFQSKVFHTSTDDMLQELKSIGTAKLQKSDPEFFGELVDKGVININKAGKPILNETIAKEALDRGLKGSIKQMGSQLVKNTYELEDTAHALTASYTKPMKLHDNYAATLQEIAEDYSKVGLGEHGAKAQSLFSKINTADNTVTADDALEIRRFLDGMRIRSSFNPGAKLTQQQTHFKELADSLRKQLANDVPGLKPVMNEYRFSIEALDSLAAEARRRGNREFISLIDSIFLGSGAGGGAPIAGVGLSGARRLINSPIGTTNIGQGINNLGQGTSKIGKILKAAPGILTGNKPTSQ